MLTRIMLVLFAVLAAAFAAQSVSAYHYDYYDVDPGMPIYNTGHYYGAYSYGYSGWHYNRVYYKYHYPYYTSRAAYPTYYYPLYPRPFLYPVRYVAYPAVAYPFPGYYW